MIMHSDLKIEETTLVSTWNSEKGYRKYYRMIPQGGTFKVQWGSNDGVTDTPSGESVYPISNWEKLLLGKINKGYGKQQPHN